MRELLRFIFLPMFRGALVTSACFGLCIAILALRTTLESVQADAIQFFWLLLLLMLYGGMFILPVSVSVGAGSGLILHSVSRLAALRFWGQPKSSVSKEVMNGIVQFWRQWPGGVVR
jgi:hypothetical protein